VELCAHFPGTEMRVTPNYLVDENWNKSSVIDVKGTSSAMEVREKEDGGREESEEAGGESISCHQHQIRSGTIHTLLSTHCFSHKSQLSCLVNAEVPPVYLAEEFYRNTFKI